MCLCVPVEPTKLLPEYENKIPKLFKPKFDVVSIYLVLLNIYFEFLYDQYLLLP